MSNAPVLEQHELPSIHFNFIQWPTWGISENEQTCRRHEIMVVLNSQQLDLLYRQNKF